MAPDPSRLQTSKQKAKAQHSMDGPPVDADGDYRLDWSDADLFSFLETLGTSSAAQQVRATMVAKTGSSCCPGVAVNVHISATLLKCRMNSRRTVQSQSLSPEHRNQAQGPL